MVKTSIQPRYGIAGRFDFIAERLSERRLGSVEEDRFVCEGIVAALLLIGRYLADLSLAEIKAKRHIGGYLLVVIALHEPLALVGLEDDLVVLTLPDDGLDIDLIEHADAVARDIQRFGRQNDLDLLPSS